MVDQRAAPDFNIVRMRAEKEDSFAEKIHPFICFLSVANIRFVKQSVKYAPLFCRQNSTDNFGHD